MIEIKIEPANEKLGTYEVHIKLPATCNKNEQGMPKILLDYTPNGRLLKRLSDEAETGLLMPTS
jgi:hypothetical protein